MENINKILEVLNKAIEDRDSEISYLKIKLERAEKQIKELTRLEEPTKEREQE